MTDAEFDTFENLWTSESVTDGEGIGTVAGDGQGQIYFAKLDDGTVGTKQNGDGSKKGDPDRMLDWFTTF